MTQLWTQVYVFCILKLYNANKGAESDQSSMKLIQICSY